MEAVTDFTFLDSKISADGDYSQEIKRRLPLESCDKPRQHVKKQRHHCVDKSPSSQSYGFSIVMYGCEISTIKKAEHRRIGAFELWCWRRLLRVFWTARRSNKSILKEINLECSLEELMLKPKLRFFGHLTRRAT